MITMLIRDARALRIKLDVDTIALSCALEQFPGISYGGWIWVLGVVNAFGLG